MDATFDWVQTALERLHMAGSGFDPQLYSSLTGLTPMIDPTVDEDWCSWRAPTECESQQMSHVPTVELSESLESIANSVLRGVGVDE